MDGTGFDPTLALPLDHPDSENSPSYWTAQRHETYRALADRDSGLADLYQSAVSLAEEQRNAAFIRLVAHCVREIGNSLPYVISRYESHPTSYARLVTDLDRAWVRARLDPQITGQNLPADSPGVEGLLIPPEVFSCLSDLISNHRSVNVSRRNAAEAMFFQRSSEGADPKTIHFAVRQWLAVLDFFMGYVHHPRERTHVADVAQFLQHFQLFENAVGSLMRGFFAPMEDLDEILAEANA